MVSLWLLYCWTQWENVNGVPPCCKAGSKASNNAVCCMLGCSPTQMACGRWRSCEGLTCPVKLTFVAVGYLRTLRSLQISVSFRRRWNDFQLRFFLVLSWTLKINNRIKPFHPQLSRFVLGKSFGQWTWRICLFSLCFHVVLASWNIFPFLFLHSVKCFCFGRRNKLLSLSEGIISFQTFTMFSHFVPILVQ